MNLEILKNLISENYLNVSDAVWLNKTFENEFNFSNGKLSNMQFADELLVFLNSKMTEIENKSIEDNLFIHTIIQRIKNSTKLNYFKLLDEQFEENDEDDDVDDMLNPYSKEELAKLKKTEENLFQEGHDNLLADLLNLIDTKYSIVYNGFNKLEYQRSKSQFWKNIGFEGFGYYSLSPQAKKLLDDIYNASEPIIKQRVAKRELEILPDLTSNFNAWVKSNNHKPNKTNLKQYLKENNIKLSNPNIDKILFDIK